MGIAIELCPPLPSRPCKFCLSLQRDSVFADFDMDDAGLIFLRRISFDGFGCCNLGDSISKMSAHDSRLLLDAIAGNQVGSVLIEEALRKYFRANQDVIWGDALARHDLL